MYHSGRVEDEAKKRNLPPKAAELASLKMAKEVNIVSFKAFLHH